MSRLPIASQDNWSLDMPLFHARPPNMSQSQPGPKLNCATGSASCQTLELNFKL